MRNFTIFFDEKEGTSPLVRLLDQLPHISVLHQIEGKGWEPFDSHNCGAMSLGDLETSLNMIFSKQNVDLKKLNEIYSRNSTRPLESFDKSGAVGFKMRFTPPIMYLPFPRYTRKLSQASAFTRRDPFKRMMLRVLKQHDIIVFMAVRQDIFRWALSKYHGDGTGKPGHLQFKLASGAIDKEAIEKINVDCNRFGKILDNCAAIHRQKRELIETLNAEGIQTSPILYEQFLADKAKVVKDICRHLKVEIPHEMLQKVLQQGSVLKKVHSDDISEFVVNHEEVMNKFGDRYISWS